MHFKMHSHRKRSPTDFLFKLVQVFQSCQNHLFARLFNLTGKENFVENSINLSKEPSAKWSSLNQPLSFAVFPRTPKGGRKIIHQETRPCRNWKLDPVRTRSQRTDPTPLQRNGWPLDMPTHCHLHQHKHRRRVLRIAGIQSWCCVWIRRNWTDISGPGERRGGEPITVSI